MINGQARWDEMGRYGNRAAKISKKGSRIADLL